MRSRRPTLPMLVALLLAGGTTAARAAEPASRSPLPAAASGLGYVEIPWAPTVCLQGDYFLTDPCSSGVTLLQPSSLDLTPYLCQYVEVSGPDVGVECTVIDPTVVVPGPAPCPIPQAGLSLAGGSPAQIFWGHVICAASYDLIRGDLAQLRATPTTIDLGVVTCLENDLPDPHNYIVQGPQDGALPAVGGAFLYLVRANGVPFGDTTYGHSTDGLERVPAAGDCPL